MNRNKLKTRLRGVLRVKTWQLFILLILAAFGTATLLRLDNIEMYRLRDEVMIADEEGPNERIQEAVNNLRAFVLNHTVIAVVEENGQQNLVFGTGPFYLENQYIRTAHREIERAREKLEAQQAESGGNDVYEQAAAYCDALAKRQGWRSWSKPHIDCMLTELAKHPEMEAIQDLTTAMIPPTALYFHRYVSPVWAPTAAGWVMLSAIIILIVIVFRILTSIFLRILLRLSRPKNR